MKIALSRVREPGRPGKTDTSPHAFDIRAGGHARLIQGHSDLVRDGGELARHRRQARCGRARLCRSLRLRAQGRDAYLALPGAGGALGAVLFGLENAGRRARPVPARKPRRIAAGRPLSFRECAARRAACRPRLRARRISFLALPQGRRSQDPSGGAGRCRCGGSHAHHRGRHARARPHQYARERHGTAGARRRRARACETAWRHGDVRDRRRSSQE